MTTRRIETKEDFRQEGQTLLDDINGNIDNLAQYEKTSMKGPTVDLAGKLNKLKIHRIKLKDALERYSESDEHDWEAVRPAAQKVFEAAFKEWQQASKTLA